jgi:RNA polymerase sigma factor (sigma-70 family)
MTADAMRAAIVQALPRVRRFAYSLTAHVADADDLLQSTVERALARGAPHDEPEALLKWMFTVCRNLWIDELRARKVRGFDDPDRADVDVQSRDGEGDILGTLAIDELDIAMSRLAAEQRAVLELVAVEGFSYREAAEVLEIPVGTVMSRLARARAALARALAPGNNSAP